MHRFTSRRPGVGRSHSRVNYQWRSVLERSVQKKLLEKLTNELFLLEKDLGIRWNPSVESGVEGYHVALQPADVEGFHISLQPVDDVPSTFEALSESTTDVARAPLQPTVRKVQTAGKIFHNTGKSLSKRERTLRQRAKNASRVAVANGSVA